jgi:acyl carrier protein
MSDFLAFRRHFRNDCFLTNALSSSEAGVIAQWQYNPSDPKTDPACGGEIRLESDRLPIGRAVSGMDLRLIDEAGNEVPPGQPGEVIVRSPHISVGYWRDPETTARHFTIDPTTGVTTFRGGDVLKQLSDGTLVFAGRSDTRLKVRGYRIEPSDVERVILSLPGVESASVGPVMGPSSEPMLVAYFKPTLGSDNDLRSLRSQMRQQLPDYMMPARFIRIDHWPLSASGKVDRHQLFSRPLPDDSDDNEGQPTQTDSERQLQSIWQRVFQRASIDRNTHFFEIGGDSLLAAIISAHVYAESGIEIPLRSFSDHPVLSDLAAFIADRQRSSDDGDLPLTKVPRTQPLPLSPAQESIWKECAAHSRSDGWTIVQRHRLTGDLNTTILTDCLKHMLERHEILRTTFTIHQGRPSAHIHAMAENTCVFLDFSDASQATEAADTRVLESLRNEPFKLDRLPLVKFWLVRVGEKEHILYRAIHHIIVDAWSWKVFFNEVGQLYRSRIENQKNPLPVAPQYADYAARQQEVVKLDSPRYVESLLWWSQRLKYPPRPLHLPFTRRKPFLEAKPTDGIVELPISSEVSRRLDQIAATCGATHYSVRFAVLVAALAELTGRRDLIVGAYSTGRRRLELQNMFGMFANLMTLRLRWNPRYTFVEWLASVHQVIAETREHAEIPYGVLCDGLRMKGIQPPAIQAIVATVDRFAPNTFGTVTLSTPERLVEVMPWGFSLLIVQNTADLWRAEFDTRRYDPDAVLPFLVRCQELFELFSLQPQRILSEIVRPVRVPPDAWLDNQQSPWTHFTLSTALRIRHRLQHLLRAA